MCALGMLLASCEASKHSACAEAFAYAVVLLDCWC